MDMLRSIDKRSGNPWSQSWRDTIRYEMLFWKTFAEKEGFKPRTKQWKGDGWWEWWVDGTDWGMSLKELAGWVRIGEISAWLTERSHELIPETREAYWKELSVIRREDDVDGRASVTKDEERVLRGGWTVMRLFFYVKVGWLWEIGKWKELVFNALGYL